MTDRADTVSHQPRACTIIARNYLPYARVLCDSFLRVHPQGVVYVLVVDAEDAERPRLGELLPGATVLTAADLPLGHADFRQMATMYDLTELATAVKPWLLELLLQRHEVVVYLDPDIEVFAGLDGVVDVAARSGLVLTPHTLVPMARDGKEPTEQHILQSGTYNLGFVAVSSAAAAFVRWWQERLRFDCVNEIPDGLFVDQKWVDLAVHYFPHEVLRDPGYNVAYWNVDKREVRRTQDGWLAAEVPLRFFHFSGFRPNDLTRLERYHSSRSRVLLEPGTALHELACGYADQVRGAQDLARDVDVAYRYATSADGMPLTRELRRAYRAAVLAGRQDLPDPFDPADATRFRAWHAEHVEQTRREAWGRRRRRIDRAVRRAVGVVRQPVQSRRPR